MVVTARGLLGVSEGDSGGEMVVMMVEGVRVFDEDGEDGNNDRVRMGWFSCCR